MKRVLHLLKTSVGGVWAYRLIREIKKNGEYEPIVVLPGEGPLAVACREENITYDLCDLNMNKKNPLSALRKVNDLCSKYDPLLLHSHFFITTITARLSRKYFKKNYPIIFQVPGPLHLENKITKYMDIRTANQKDYWIGSCKKTCSIYLKEKINKQQIYLSYYGVDLKEFQLERKGYLRQILNISPETKIVGMVSYIYPPKYYLGYKKGIKGHEDMIEALKLVFEKRKDVVGVFVGGAWGKAFAYEKKIYEYGKRLLGERVYFLGNRNDVKTIYPDFDLAVHPSHSENIGGAGESLLYGIPTITTNIGGFPDIIEEGVTGWMVPPKTPKMLARRILQVLGNKEEAIQCAARGRERATNMFDIKKTSKQVNDIYSSILLG